MLVGVALSAYSGILREKEQNVGSSKVNNSQKSSLVKGLVIVVSSGILSSLLNVGFEAAIPIIDNAKSFGCYVFGFFYTGKGCGCFWRIIDECGLCHLSVM